MGCLQGARHPQKIVASLKSQDLTRMILVTTVQPTRKWYSGRNAAMVRSQISVDTGCCNFTEASGPHPVHEKYFFPISASLIQPQHLSSHKRGRRQWSQRYGKQLAEPAADICHLLAVVKTGQIRKMSSLAALTWKTISSQLPGGLAKSQEAHSCGKGIAKTNVNNWVCDDPPSWTHLQYPIPGFSALRRTSRRHSYSANILSYDHKSYLNKIQADEKQVVTFKGVWWPCEWSWWLHSSTWQSIKLKKKLPLQFLVSAEVWEKVWPLQDAHNRISGATDGGSDGCRFFALPFHQA